MESTVSSVAQLPALEIAPDEGEELHEDGADWAGSWRETPALRNADCGLRIGQDVRAIPSLQHSITPFFRLLVFMRRPLPQLPLVEVDGPRGAGGGVRDRA